jgi:cytochrome c oxidase assembly factor CtaG
MDAINTPRAQLSRRGAPEFERANHDRRGFMSLRSLALNWRIDGSDATAFLVLVAATGTLYLLAAARGNSRDRRGRRWPRGRSVCFMAGLGVLVVDLYSGIGAQAEERLSAHMIEHMVMWVIVAPLLAAGAPVRVAFYWLPRRGRRTLARWLRSRVVSAITTPAGSILLFSAALLVTHLPVIYGLALSNSYVHEVEHGLYLLTSLLVWVPLIGVDPVPHRPGPRGRFAWMSACMLPMVAIAVWLGTAPEVVYTHYLHALGARALADQHQAATIMWAGGLPAFLAPLLAPRLMSVQITPRPSRRPTHSQLTPPTAPDH